MLLQSWHLQWGAHGYLQCYCNHDTYNGVCAATYNATAIMTATMGCARLSLPTMLLQSWHLWTLTVSAAALHWKAPGVHAATNDATAILLTYWGVRGYLRCYCKQSWHLLTLSVLSAAALQCRSSWGARGGDKPPQIVQNNLKRLAYCMLRSAQLISTLSTLKNKEILNDQKGNHADGVEALAVGVAGWQRICREQNILKP